MKMVKNDNLAINAVSLLGIDAINEANSGHPGIVLGAAPMLHVLYTRHIKIYPNQPKWINRDRFILSAGHGSALLYSINHVCGFKITIDDLKNFRQLGNTPGHPEYNHTDGVETTSGPLGQGISNAVGIAIAQKHLSARFNKKDFNLIDHYTYVLCGDGDLQEGVTQEAMSLAGHLGLGKLIVLFDSNDIQLDGKTALSISENFKKKMEAIGWHYIFVEDGTNLDAIDKAIKKAKKEVNKPSIIEVKTIIGRNTKVAGTSKVHGSPIGFEEAASLRGILNYNYPNFFVSQEVYDLYQNTVIKRGKREFNKWNKLSKTYAVNHSSDKQLFDQFLSGELKVDFSTLNYEPGSKEATRNVLGKGLDLLSKDNLNIIGGSADLTSSTKAKGADGNFLASSPLGRNINFGVREHAMGSIVNGITLHGGLKAFAGGFFVFSDYMRPPLRLAAMMEIPSVFIFSHDSIGVGEDGPTHEPIEQLIGLRSIPKLNTIRPADATETLAALQIAFGAKKGAHAIITTRQNVVNLPNTSLEGVLKGAYVVSSEKNKLDGILLASGSEVSLACEVKDLLLQKGIDVRVVSMPSHYAFLLQSNEYKDKILPQGVNTLAIEMGSTYSWYRFTKHVYGIDEFGASAPVSDLLKHFKFTKEDITSKYIEIFG